MTGADVTKPMVALALLVVIGALAFWARRKYAA